VQVIHPGQFRTRPCPGYAGIDLAVRPGRQMAQLLDAAAADAVHIATEGPLGWAARAHCLPARLAFTTAFHTKFPEILHAALKVPLSWGYALFRHFHKPSAGVMVPTQGVLRMLEARGFRNLRAWTHGVDTTLFQTAESRRCTSPWGRCHGPVALFVGRVSYEKNIEAFLQLDFPGTKVVCGVGPLEAELRAALSRRALAGPAAARRTGAGVCGGRPVCVSQPLGNLWPGDAGGHGHGTPVAAYPVDGPLEVLGQPACRAARCMKTCNRPALPRWPCPGTRHGPARCNSAGPKPPALSPATWCRCHSLS
jgi:hypothetical protein